MEAPVPGQPCPPGASAATRQLNIPKGPKKRARTRTTQIQMGQPPTTASPRSPGGSASRQATATALQGQQTHRRRLEEVNQSAAVLRRSRGNWIVTQFDLLVLESHQGVPLHLVRAAAAAFPHERRSAVHLPAADDWRCGHFSALERARALWEGYSLVFLTNSDVMITPLASHRLETLVTDRAHSKAAFFVTQWRRTANAYNTDAFLFRPTQWLLAQPCWAETRASALHSGPTTMASTARKRNQAGAQSCFVPMAHILALAEARHRVAP